MCLISDPKSPRKNTEMCEGFEYGDSHESVLSTMRDQSDPTVAGEENSCEEDLMADNVRSFITMGIL